MMMNRIARSTSTALLSSGARRSSTKILATSPLVSRQNILRNFLSLHEQQSATKFFSTLPLQFDRTQQQNQNVDGVGTEKAKFVRVADARQESLIGQTVVLKGWVRTIRSQKHLSFIDLNDGSSLSGMQIVVGAHSEEHQQLMSKIHTGTSIEVTGKVIKSPANKQPTEMLIGEDAEGNPTPFTIRIIGECDASTYPLQKKKHSIEFLRDNAHLRSRTNTGSAVIRVRNEAMMAIHDYFQSENFYHVHTPIITGSDCEGAGEQFRVITSEDEVKFNSAASPATTTTSSPSSTEASSDAAAAAGKSFFGTDVYLTVSGQLAAEIFATSMSRVYTFGPTFRAETGKTSRHLAEFWMVEMEQAFVDMPTLMKHGENMVKSAIRRVLTKCADDIQFFQQWHDKELLQRLEHTLNTPFQVITYTEAIDILRASGEKFVFPVEWGCNLQSEHEIYICKHFGVPTFVTHYPKVIKPFYARVTSEEPSRETVGAFDLLVPNLGELIGGSEREERYDVLVQTMKEKDLNIDSYAWYLELRRFGTVPHGGFGIGFERLILFLTGLSNIREAIPLPRAVGSCKF